MATENATTHALAIEHVLRLRDAGARVLDVRDPVEFFSLHLRGSVSLAIVRSMPRAPAFGSSVRDVMPIVIIGEPGTESAVAARLRREGFDNVLGYVRGGIHAFDDMPEELVAATGIESQ